MFSVIIPLYNKAPYIEQAIRSVLQQTFQEFEIIVIDDGSTDESLVCLRNVCDEICACEPSFRSKISIIEQTNQGVSTTRNNGAKVAKYDYFAFLDADDWWDTVFLERMNGVIKEYPQNGIYASGYYVSKGKNIRVGKTGVGTDFHLGIINYAKLLAKGDCRPLWTGAVIISKKDFFNVEGFNPNLTLGEDFDLFFRISMKNGVVLLNLPLSFYNVAAEPKNRLTSQFHKKENSYVFNMNYSESELDGDMKYLLDFLRLRSFYPYYIKGLYLFEINSFLSTVKWLEHKKIFFMRYKVIPRKIMQLCLYLRIFFASLVPNNLKKVLWKRK